MSVFAIDGPEMPDVPLFLDSPHSGSDYPADFKPAPPMSQVKRAEDFAVDRLFAGAPSLGVPLLKALFPRIVVDVNRAMTDIDPATVAGTLPFAAAPSAKAELGKGVVWTEAPPPPDKTPLYDAPLPAETITAWLARYWTPYRDALAERLAAIRAQHGRVLYIDCHSMQSVSTAMHEEGAGIERSEIVISDRDGATCDPALFAAFAEALEAEGFQVAINAPYKGADLIVSHGRPSEGFHAIQIEIRRNLYMNEDTLTLSDRFEDTQSRLTRAIADTMKGRLAFTSLK